jgi:hypothetical protein
VMSATIWGEQPIDTVCSPWKYATWCPHHGFFLAARLDGGWFWSFDLSVHGTLLSKRTQTDPVTNSARSISPLPPFCPLLQLWKYLKIEQRWATEHEMNASLIIDSHYRILTTVGGRISRALRNNSAPFTHRSRCGRDTRASSVFQHLKTQGSDPRA